jgi:poly(beta-D-mannuronate) lyase
MPISNRSFFFLVGCSLAFCASNSFGATYVVATVGDLQSRIDAAAAGDTITVKNGVYTTSAAITIKQVGTAEKPILIAAETVGGVEIRGAFGFKLESPAAYITIEGCTFKHASGQTNIAPDTHHCRFSRCAFECTGEGAYLTVSGDDAEIDRNEFRNKKTLGNMISVTGSGSQVARRLWIHHNYFHDFANAHGNGAETIRFGLSGLSMSTGAGVIEYNLFLRCTGENEIISNKSCGNTYRYNTFQDSPGGELSQRHGNDCLIYGNYFRNTQGIRIFGDRHQVFSNYLEANSSAISIGNGDGEVADGAKLTSHDRPDGCVISFNTLINNKVNYQMGGRTNGLGATHTTFANNLILGGGKAAEISTTAPYVDPIWSGNLIWKTGGGSGDLPSAGYSSADPLLAPDENGIYHLQAGSPAIDSASGNYPAVKFDMDGQPRSEPKDKGADEFLPKAQIAARYQTPAAVGPTQ